MPCYHIISYDIMSYYIISYYIILFYFILNLLLTHYLTLHRATPLNFTPLPLPLHHTTLYHTISHYTTQVKHTVFSGPTTSYAFTRLELLSAKFNFHILLNGTRELNASKSVPHRDFYNVRKVDTHVHHSVCIIFMWEISENKFG